VTSNPIIPHSYHPFSTTNYSSNVILISLPLTFVFFYEHYRYFYFVFFWRGVISEIPRLLEIWKDPKINNTMYKKDMLRDWTFALSRIVLGILTARRKNSYIQSLRFKTNMSQDFFRDLEHWRRRHQERRNWRGGGIEGKKTSSRF
jgi:hypothetical protein